MIISTLNHSIFVSDGGDGVKNHYLFKINIVPHMATVNTTSVNLQ